MNDRLKSQTARLLAYLQSGKKINVFSPAKQRLRIGYLNSRVADLRKAGEPVQSDWITCKDSSGEPVNVKQYYLKQD